MQKITITADEIKAALSFYYSNQISNLLVDKLALEKENLRLEAYCASVEAEKVELNNRIRSLNQQITDDLAADAKRIIDKSSI